MSLEDPYIRSTHTHNFRFLSVLKGGSETSSKTLDAERCTMTNILADLPDAIAAEVFTLLIERSGVRIERIVSQGQITPVDAPYDQDHDEWVLLLSGRAGLWLENAGERDLTPGDTVLIPAHVRHRVTWTSITPPAVWLAVHLEGQ